MGTEGIKWGQSILLESNQMGNQMGTEHLVGRDRESNGDRASCWVSHKGTEHFDGNTRKD